MQIDLDGATVKAIRSHLKHRHDELGTGELARLIAVFDRAVIEAAQGDIRRERAEEAPAPGFADHPDVVEVRGALSAAGMRAVESSDRLTTGERIIFTVLRPGDDTEAFRVIVHHRGNMVVATVFDRVDGGEPRRHVLGLTGAIGWKLADGRGLTALEQRAELSSLIRDLAGRVASEAAHPPAPG